MQSSNKESNNLKDVLKKNLVCVLIASIVLQLTACRHQQSVIRERVVSVPEHVIDTVFAYRLDTTYIFETDTLRIETTIRDTLVHQRVSTKPQYLILRDTVPNAELIKAKQRAESAEQTSKMAIDKLEKPFRTAALIFCTIVSVIIAFSVLRYQCKAR